MAEPDCVFCGIIEERLPGSFVYSDDLVVAFMDIYPVNPGHLLITPRAHASYLSDMDEGAGAQMFSVAMRLQEAIRSSGVRCEGVNLFVADGVAAGQEVFHVHLHVIPRFEGDGFNLTIDYPPRPSRVRLDEHAQAIRAALG